MGALEPWHLIVILGIALIVFGPGKIGELGGTLGKAMHDFRDASEGKSPVARAQTCVNCRSSVPAGAKFCPGCGLEAARVTLTSSN
jgi:sec-independent protein translocase protein TatA